MKLDASNLLGKLLEPQRHSYEVWYQVTSLPQHGVVTVGVRNLTSTKPNFSQFILDKFGTTYQHDDSETIQDFFTFDAWLNRKGQPPQRPSEHSLIVTESFDLTVTPVNDQPPLLRTKAPSLRLLQGDTVVFSPENLQVEDPEEIHYKVISKPNNGYLALAEHLNETVSAFSQADINEGRVHFVQDGEPSLGVFYFSMTNGGSEPVFHILSPPKHGKLAKVTFDLSDGSNHSVESFTFRDVVQGRVALEEALGHSNNTANQSRSLLSQLGNFADHNTTEVHVSMLNDSFKFLLWADNVQPVVGKFLFTIVPYDKSINLTTRSPGHNQTTGDTGTTIHSATHPHTTNHKTHNKKTLQKQFKGNQTLGGHPIIPTVPKTTHGKHDLHGPHRNTPVWVESLPRPASDPLLLILPFLACLLLIVILVVLILVLRHHREKKALSRGLIQELTAAAGGPEGSPDLGWPERSIGVPSVVVTPLLGPNSCPSSPVLNELRRGTPVPCDPCLLLWAVDVVPDMVQAQHCRTPTTLRDN
ncbi:hypothetical protein J4Q44_G00131410 [Coregonus suidteri]|uniref:Uncharacterized protein n=1 Tax=Coregonus suidteri TaxID=861788 RepID=A0AAN8LU33_9TELE